MDEIVSAAADEVASIILPAAGAIVGVITSQNQLRRVTADLEGDSEESKKQRDNKVRGGIAYSDTRQNDNCGNSCFRSQPQRTPGGSNTATGGGNDADSDGDGDSDCSCDSCDCDCDCG